MSQSNRDKRIALAQEYASWKCPFCEATPIFEPIDIHDRQPFGAYCCEDIEELDRSCDQEIAHHITTLSLLDSSFEVAEFALGEDERVQMNHRLTPVFVSQRQAKAWINTHHRHNRAPAGWKFGIGLANGLDLCGIVWVGRPVARMLDDGSTLEVNRLCVDPTLDPFITKNASSKLYSLAAKRARQMGYKRLVTYTLGSESGHSLKASGWHFDGVAGGGSWSRQTRGRVDKHNLEKKVRWQKPLAK